MNTDRVKRFAAFIRLSRLITLLHLVSTSGVSGLFDGPDLKLFILVGWDRSCFAVACPTGAQLMTFVCFRFPVVLFGSQGISNIVSSPRICFFIVLNRDLFVCRDDSLKRYLESYHAYRTTKRN